MQQQAVWIHTFNLKIWADSRYVLNICQGVQSPPQFKRN